MKLTIRTEDKTRDVAKAAEAANYQNLGHAGASIRRTMVKGIRKSERYAKPGKPIHTRAGLARKAIRFAVDREAETAVVGPRASIIGDALSVHEHGGRYRRRRYLKRPFAFPALLESIPRLGPTWSGTIGK